MKSVELTKNEREVFEAIVDNSKKAGDSGIEFILQDVSQETKKSIRSVSATAGRLQEKGLIICCNGEGYFDGYITDKGLHEVESSKVNNEQEVNNNNSKSNSMATKANKTVKVEDSKSVNNAFENFDTPVMDERIVKLNELKAVKMAAISSKKRPAAKEAKELATYILNNWDNFAELKNIKSEDVTNEDIQNILASRLKNFEDASKASEEAVKEEKPAKAEKAPTNKGAKKVDKEEQPKEKEAKTARKVGDVHPNHPTWIWTEYAEGKFDWRTNPADKKQGQRTDKAKTSEKKSEPKKKAAKKETKPVKEEKKELTIDEFVALPSKTAKGNKKPSEAQKEALKLVMKGYRVTADHKFFENAEGDKKACNWESVTAMLRRYGMEYIPSGLVK